MTEGLYELARHLPGQVVRTAVAVSPFDKPRPVGAFGPEDQTTFHKALPWAVGGLMLYVGYQVFFGRRKR